MTDLELLELAIRRTQNKLVKEGVNMGAHALKVLADEINKIIIEHNEHPRDK